MQVDWIWRALLAALLLFTGEDQTLSLPSDAELRPAPAVRYGAPALINYEGAMLPPADSGSLRWRIGVGVSEASLLAFAWPEARPGWFHNWTHGLFEADGGLPPTQARRYALDAHEGRLGMEYVTVLRTKGGTLYVQPELLESLAQAHPGQTWIVGNEPDVAAQDWATPTEYTAAYHRAYTALKTGDPTAQIVAGNIGQVTPVRLRYLDAVLAAYQEQFGTAMPVDIWGIHVFVLNEGAGEWGIGLPPGLPLEAGAGQRRTIDEHDDVSLIDEQLRLMRGWMIERGYGNQPLWITEYGILLSAELGFTPERTAAFLEASFNLFQTLRDPNLGLGTDEDRLVQRWVWFSTRSDEFPAGDLFDMDGQPTVVMNTLQSYLLAEQ